jgi:4-amino-4-deoxy-L-arabinose transferase-like glycosyltransferase
MFASFERQPSISDNLYFLLSFSKRQMNKGQRTKDKGQIIWLIFAAVAIFIYFFALGSVPLIGPDEPRYSQVAREMFERGDWVTPTLGGYNWFEKPSLLYWLQIAFYNIFGVSEFSARLGSALFGLGTILSLWILGRFITTETPERHRENEIAKDKGQRTKDNFANWLFLISATSIGLLAFSRGASFDIILTFPITAALVSFFIHDQSDKKSPFIFHFSLFAFYFFIGLALLAKGLVGIVLPFAIVAFYYLLSLKFPRKTFIFSLFWGTILSLLVAASWYLPMYLVHGWTFIDEFFIQHHFQRYTSNKYMHPQPFWFFWLVLPLMTLPWLPFFLAAIWNLFKVQSPKSKVQSQEKTSRNIPFLPLSLSPLLLFSLSWLLVPLVFFSFSGSKLPGYILPALPAALILTADYVSRFAEKSRARENALKGVAAGMFLLVFVILQFVIDSYARHDTVKYLIAEANAQGYSNAKILTLHTISHNAEFYGAGRLIRLPNGKQRQLYNPAEVLEQIRLDNNNPVLVLVSLEYLHTLTENESVSARVLGKNNALAIAAVESK